MEPATLQEAIAYFSDPDHCREYFIARRWPDGVTCPRCDSRNVVFQSKYNRWQCASHHQRRQFTLKTGTIFEDSPLGLDKWLAAMWQVVNCKNGVSSYQVHRAIGVTQKTTWFMDHRIRFALGMSAPDKFSGQVEADEMYIGGIARNMHIAHFSCQRPVPSFCSAGLRARPHQAGGLVLLKKRTHASDNCYKSKRERVIRGTCGADKTIVMGLLEGHTDPKSKEKVIRLLDYDPKKSKKASRVKVTVVPDTKKKTLQTEVRNSVEAGSEVFTDELVSYRGLAPEFVHGFVNHARTICEWACPHERHGKLLVTLETYDKGNLCVGGALSFISLLGRRNLSLQPLQGHTRRRPL